MLYVPLLLGGFVAAVVLRWRMRKPDGDPLRDGPRLDVATYELALLRSANGPVDAAVASLVHRGDLAIEQGKLRALRSPLKADPVEQAVYAAVQQGRTTPERVRATLSVEHERLHQQLVRKGLLMDSGMRARAWLVPVLLYGLILLLGLVKLYLGFTRHKPSTLLFLCLCSGLLSMFFLVAMRPRVSRLGDKTLRALTKRHAGVAGVAGAAAMGEAAGVEVAAAAAGVAAATEQPPTRSTR
jgi:uncharacterized protein (TIGR04222 family)